MDKKPDDSDAVQPPKEGDDQPTPPLKIMILGKESRVISVGKSGDVSEKEPQSRANNTLRVKRDAEMKKGSANPMAVICQVFMVPPGESSSSYESRLKKSVKVELAKKVPPNFQSDEQFPHWPLCHVKGHVLTFSHRSSPLLYRINKARTLKTTMMGNRPFANPAEEKENVGEAAPKPEPDSEGVESIAENKEKGAESLPNDDGSD